MSKNVGLFIIAAVGYLVYNAIFASLYRMNVGGPFAGKAFDSGFGNAFVLSCSISSTIGYGPMSPKTEWAKGLTVLQATILVASFVVVPSIFNSLPAIKESLGLLEDEDQE